MIKCTFVAQPLAESTGLTLAAQVWLSQGLRLGVSAVRFEPRLDLSDAFTGAQRRNYHIIGAPFMTLLLFCCLFPSVSPLILTTLSIWKNLG